MTEDETISVNNQEAAVPDVNSEDHKVDQANQVSKEQEVGSKDYNFAQMRKKLEELERSNYELQRAVSVNNAPKPNEEVDELANLAEDDILTVAQAKKLSQRQAQQIVEDILNKREHASLPEKTRGKFNDYDAIMNEENIRKLEQEEPGLAAACAKAPNPWEATYKILKKFVVPSQEAKTSKSEAKLSENLSKPVSSNSVGRAGPLNDANLWAEASQQDLYKEMMQASRSGY